MSPLIVVVPDVLPMSNVVAADANVRSVTPLTNRLNAVDVVAILVTKIGDCWNTTLPVPVVSVIRPRNCVDVVDENDARVSDLKATSPPSLKLTLIC